MRAWLSNLFRSDFPQVGESVLALHGKEYYEAIVLDVVDNVDTDCVLVHFKGLSRSHDVWIPKDSLYQRTPENIKKLQLAEDSNGPYKRINGKNFNREMIDLSEKAALKDDGICEGVVKEIVNLVVDTNDEVSKRTLLYIRGHYRLEEKARRRISKAIQTLDCKDEDLCSNSDEWKTELRAEFAKQLQPGSKKLERFALIQILETMGRRAKSRKLTHIFEALDPEHEGAVDIEEFLKYFREHHAPVRWAKAEKKKKAKKWKPGHDPSKSIQQLFDTHDVEHCQSLSKEQFIKALLQMGMTIDQAQVDENFEAFDRDKNGRLEFAEFSKYVEGHVEIEDDDSGFKAKRSRTAAAAAAAVPSPGSPQ